MSCDNSGEMLLFDYTLAYLEENNRIEQSKLFQRVFCEEMQHVPFDKIEEKLQTIKTKVIESYEGIFVVINSAMAEKSNQIQENILLSLQRCIEMMEGLHCFIQYIITQNVTCNKNVRSVPQIACQMIKQAYSHCAESTTIYGEIVEEVSSQLSSLFRKAHSLHVISCSLLETIVYFETDNSLPSDTDDIIQVLNDYADISQLILAIDMKILVVTWKTISRLACKFKQYIKNAFNMTDIVKTLLSQTYRGLEMILDLPSQKAQDGHQFKTSLKVVGFLVKVIALLTKEDYLTAGSILELYKLLLKIMVLLPCTPYYVGASMTTEMYVAMQCHLVDGIEPIISRLVNSQRFCAVVTDKVDQAENRLVHLLVQLTVLPHITKASDDVLKMWMGEGTELSIVNSILLSTHSCSDYHQLTDLKFSSRSANGPVRNMGLYEYTVRKLNALTAVCPAECFPRLEVCLFGHLASSSACTATLAEDMLCFVARYGTAGLCQHYCHLLASLLADFQQLSPQSQNLVSLLKRLFHVLPKEHQEHFVNCFPPTESHVLWNVLPLSCMNNKTLVQQIMNTSINHYLKGIHNSLQSVSMSSVQVLISSLGCLDNILSNHKLVKQFASQGQMTMMASKVVVDVWNSMELRNEVDITDSTLQHLLVNLMNVTARLIRYLKIKDIEKVIAIIMRLLEHKSTGDKSTGDMAAIGVTTFLRQLGNLTLPPETHILDKLPQMFASILKHNNVFVVHHGLVSFAQFAQETNHESVITQTVQQFPELQQQIVNFIKKIPHQVESFDLETFLHECYSPTTTH